MRTLFRNFAGHLLLLFTFATVPLAHAVGCDFVLVARDQPGLPQNFIVDSYAKGLRLAGVRYLLFSTSVESYIEEAKRLKTRDELLSALILREKQIKLRPMFDGDKGRLAASLAYNGTQGNRANGVEYFYDELSQVNFLIPVEILDQLDFSARFITMQGPPAQFDKDKFDYQAMYKFAQLAANFERFSVEEFAKYHRVYPNDNIDFTIPKQALPASFSSVLWLPAPALHRLNNQFKDYPGADHPLIPRPGAMLPVTISLPDKDGHMGFASAPLAQTDETEVFFDSRRGYGTWFYHIPDWAQVEKLMSQNGSPTSSLLKPDLRDETLDSIEQVEHSGPLNDSLLLTCSEDDSAKNCDLKNLVNAIQSLLLQTQKKALAKPNELYLSIRQEMYVDDEELTLHQNIRILNALINRVFKSDPVKIHSAVGSDVATLDPFQSGRVSQIVDRVTPRMLKPKKEVVKLVWLIKGDARSHGYKGRLVTSAGFEPGHQVLLTQKTAQTFDPLLLTSFRRLNGFANAGGLNYGGVETPAFLAESGRHPLEMIGAVLTVGRSPRDHSGISPIHRPDDLMSDLYD